MAQLGARFHGMEEVIGSIPIRSTNFKINHLQRIIRSGYRTRMGSIRQPASGAG